MSANVVVIVIDALRKDCVGAFGGRELTPNIDELAADSAVFSEAYTTCNSTDAAVTSIQTGRHILSHGITSHSSGVTAKQKEKVEQVLQLPEVLSELGYRTGKFGRPLGRWHRKGFDRYPSEMEGRLAVDNNNNKSKSTEEKISNTLARIHPRLQSTASKLYQNITQPSNKEGVVSDYENQQDKVIQNIDDFISKGDSFYSFIHLMDTHEPYFANPKTVASYLEKFDYTPDVPLRVRTSGHSEEFDRLVKNGEYPQIRDRYYLNNGEPTTAITNAYYHAAATRADKRVGEVLDLLKNNEIYDDSLIILCSDHGESLTEHGIYYDHHGLYDVTAQIPLIIRPPNGINKNINQMTQTTDIAPTIESYVNSDMIDADGTSLRPVIENGKPINRKYVITEEVRAQRRRMVRSKDSKLIYSLDNNTVCEICGVQHASAVELYDIENDPKELNNISNENPELVEELRSYGDEKEKEFKNKAPSEHLDDNIEYDDENVVVERMEALGYR